MFETKCVKNSHFHNTCPEAWTMEGFSEGVKGKFKQFLEDKRKG